MTEYTKLHPFGKPDCPCGRFPEDFCSIWRALGQKLCSWCTNIEKKEDNNGKD